MPRNLLHKLPFFKKDETDKLSKLILKDGQYREDCSAAIAFIKKNPNADFNFHKQYTYYGIPLSLVDIAYINDIKLLSAILEHPSMQHNAIHDTDFLFDRVENSPEIRAFYKKHFIIPQNQKLQVLKPLSINSQLTGKNNFSEAFKDFPQDNKWRLFIDSKKQIEENGWLDFECREPGYLQGMYAAWDLVENSIEDDLSIGLIKSLHLQCTGGVRGMVNSLTPGCFRQGCSRNGLSEGENVSIAGLIELIESEHYNRHYHIENAFIKFPTRELALFENDITHLMNEYYGTIHSAPHPEKKLFCIIRLISSLERLHPFSDGNTRLFSMILLNRELIKQGFSPTIMQNPNRSVGFSQRELYDEIIQGMETFQQIKAGHFLGKGNQAIQELLMSDEKYDICKESPENSNLSASFRP